MKSTHILATIMACQLLSGCGAPKAPAENSPTPVASASAAAPTPSVTADAPAMPEAKFTDEDKALADNLLKTWKDNYFDNKEVRKIENARGFLYLAAKAEDPAQKAAAIKATRESYVDYKDDKKLQIDDDYRSTIFSSLKSDNKEVQEAAIGAAYSIVRADPPHQETLDVLLDLANNHPEASGRWEAANTISAVSGQAGRPEVVELFFKLYKDEDFIVASAVKWTPIDFRNDDTLRERTLAELKTLLNHEHPVIRGRAMTTFAKLCTDDALVVETAKKMVEDKEPFVVAETLQVMGKSKDESLIPLISKFFDDNRESQAKLEFPKLSGKSVTSTLGSLTGHSVADVATRALDKVTDARPDKGFEAKKPGFGKKREGDIAKNVSAAKEWVAKNKT